MSHLCELETLVERGERSLGCPLGSHPAHLRADRVTVRCRSCVQACANRSVQLRLQPIGGGPAPNRHNPTGERGRILVMAGGICLHHWQRLLGWRPLAPESLQKGPMPARISFDALALALPSAADLWLDRCWLFADLPLLWAQLHAPMVWLIPL